MVAAAAACCSLSKNLANAPVSRAFPFQRDGFTLVEMLVVISIVAVLAAIAFPVYQSMQDSAKAAQCSSNLREIYMGISGYVQDNNGRYPSSRGSGTNINSFWFIEIGPYLEPGRRFDPAKVRTGPWPQDIPFACPACTNHGWGGAGIDVGINGYQVGATVDPRSVSDALRTAKASALSTTLLVADAGRTVGNWQIGFRIGTNGSFTASAANDIAPRHNGRANILYFDGHVGQVTEEQLKDPKLIEQLGGPKF